MSSTNKTPNYDLPQFVANDVPSWLGDFNQAMSKIDTQMKANDSKAQSAETNAENANSSATQALQTANQANTTANGANTNATNALSLATTANDNASTAKQNAATALSTANTANGLASSANSTAQNANTNANKALTELNKFNLTNSQIIGSTGIIGQTNVGSVVASGTTINIISDSTNKVFKLYGVIEVTVNEGGHVYCTAQSNLRPSQKIQISNTGFALYNTQSNVDTTDFSVDTNGLITFHSWINPAYLGDKNFRMYFMNCLYFLDAFDQVIVDPN